MREVNPFQIFFRGDTGPFKDEEGPTPVMPTSAMEGPPHMMVEPHGRGSDLAETTEWPIPVVASQPEDTVAQDPPRRSGRARQPVQQPDNVYSGSPLNSCLTDLWRRLVGDSFPQGPSNSSKNKSNGNALVGYDSCKTAQSKLLSTMELLQLITEEGGDSLQNFLLCAAKRYTLPPNKGETKLPDPVYIYEWTYKDILCFPGKLKEEWRQACLNELSTLKEWQVFKLVPLPKGKKPIRKRWVFKISSQIFKSTPI